MTIHRTPEARFADLPDFPFGQHYHTLSDGLRLHYLDEGPRDATPVLMMHGEPTWSFLYRKMIGPVVDAGYRVLAPDLIGFGRSDKPTDQDAFTYAGHVAWMREWFEAMDLSKVVLVCQDWGSLIGLRLVAAMPEKFSAVVLSNGALPTGQPMSDFFTHWVNFAKSDPAFLIGDVIQGGTAGTLPEPVVAAYDAPFDSEDAKAAARKFPSLVPLGENEAIPDQLAAWEVLKTFEKPFTCCFSDADPITKGGDEAFLKQVPGAKDNDLHRTLKGGHFIQEDDPEGFVAAVLETAERARA